MLSLPLHNTIRCSFNRTQNFFFLQILFWMFQRITMWVCVQNVSKKNIAFSSSFQSFTTFSFRSILSVAFVRLQYELCTGFYCLVRHVMMRKNVLFNGNCFMCVWLQSWNSVPHGEWPQTFLCGWTKKWFWVSAKTAEFWFSCPSQWFTLLSSHYTPARQLLTFINIVIGNMNYLLLMLRLMLRITEYRTERRERFVVKKPHLVGVSCTSTKQQQQQP